MSACLPDVACIAMLTLKLVDQGGGHVRCEFVFVVKEVLCFKSFKIRYNTCVAQELVYAFYAGRDHPRAFLDERQTVINLFFIVVFRLLRKSFIETFFNEGGVVAVLKESIFHNFFVFDLFLELIADS